MLKMRKKMKLTIDKESDALYFRIDETPIAESEEVEPGIILDFNSDGKVVGVEMLGLSARIKPEQLNILQYQTA